MRILHIYKDYAPVLGGIENHLQLVAEHQVRRGHQVTVLVTSRDRKTAKSRENGVEVLRAGRLLELRSTPLSLALFGQLRRLWPEVAHLHFPYPPGELAQWLFGRSQATVMTYHSDIVRQRFLLSLYRPLMLRCLARVDRILPTSTAYAKSSPVLTGFERKCRIVPLGIETARFTKVDARRMSRLRRRFPGPLVLFVGRLRYYKALHVLIEAMETLDASLLVVGQGPMEEPWRTAASSSSARVHFLGDVDEPTLLDCYTAADIFVLPSNRRSEAYGLAQVEAMAAGTPVISTELGTGTSFVNQDGKTGFVVPPDDVFALRAALARLLEDAVLRIQMGERARQRATDELDVERMLDRLDEVYAETLRS